MQLYIIYEKYYIKKNKYNNNSSVKNLVSVIVNPFNHFVWLWIVQAMNTICSVFSV